jgi:hypothetical protein
LKTAERGRVPAWAKELTASGKIQYWDGNFEIVLQIMGQVLLFKGYRVLLGDPPVSLRSFRLRELPGTAR